MRVPPAKEMQDHKVVTPSGLVRKSKTRPASGAAGRQAAALTAERRMLSLGYAIRGGSYRKIAEVLKREHNIEVSHKTVMNDIRVALREYGIEDERLVTELRGVQKGQLDVMTRKLMEYIEMDTHDYVADPDHPDKLRDGGINRKRFDMQLKAIGMMIKVAGRYALLFGTDKPVRQEIQHSVSNAPRTVIFFEQQARDAETLEGELARDMAAADDDGPDGSVIEVYSEDYGPHRPGVSDPPALTLSLSPPPLTPATPPNARGWYKGAGGEPSIEELERLDDRDIMQPLLRLLR